jgi:regulator of RNase E activity RraA
MKQRGVRGVVLVDGGIRDLNEFLVMKDFPIY